MRCVIVLVVAYSFKITISKYSIVLSPALGCCAPVSCTARVEYSGLRTRQHGLLRQT
jgi:hypothetical protein